MKWLLSIMSYVGDPRNNGRVLRYSSSFNTGYLLSTISRVAYGAGRLSFSIMSCIGDPGNNGRALRYRGTTGRGAPLFFPRQALDSFDSLILV